LFGAASAFNSAVARIAGLIATPLLEFVFAQQGSPKAFMRPFASQCWSAPRLRRSPPLRLLPHPSAGTPRQVIRKTLTHRY
jgi:hypothetical protein